MFSATYPQNIKELASVALRPQYELVDTVGEEETHAAEQVMELVKCILSTVGAYRFHLNVCLRTNRPTFPG